MNLTCPYIISSDTLVDKVGSFCKSNGSNRIVLSVCSGRSETEMQASSDDLCVCFDNDKRSLYASAISYKYLHPKKSNVIFHYHNMASGLLNILQAIKLRTNLPIVVLFQHPSPTGGRLSREAIASASMDCMLAMASRFVDCVHYVYDHHDVPSKTFWRDNSLRSLCTSKCNNETTNLLSVGQIHTICKPEQDKFAHPVFGLSLPTRHAERNGFSSVTSIALDFLSRKL